MIGGKDIYLHTPSGISALDCALRTIRLFWPNAVFENGTTAEIVENYKDLAFSGMLEILAYQNVQAFKQWEIRGADPELAGTMIHLMAAAEELTLVIDEKPNHQIETIITSIRHALRMNPFGGTTAREAA